MDKRIKKIHMIGIGGAGMSGIAEILIAQGYEITGSDMAENTPVSQLRKLGAQIAIGHKPGNIGNVQVVIRSTAIRDDNPEIVEARNRHIPIIPRAEMLAELMRLKKGIAIAGTHGKTTTTSLCASIFDEARCDPTVIIGGRINVYGTNAHLGSGDFLIAEADESDGSFLCLFSIINIITNIDNDHLDYYGTPGAIDEAFLSFMNKVPFYGLNVVCGDNERIMALLRNVKRPFLTYGFGRHNQLRAEILETGANTIFEVFQNDKKLGVVRLPQPGKHNVLNALAAIGAALSADISFEQCAMGLEKFKGVGRRFEWKGERQGVTVIDDYGHHPAEIAATLNTARDVFPNRRLVVAFQPHRFSRTKALFNDFCHVFNRVDKLLLTEIYPASEKPLPGVTGQSLAQGIINTCGTSTKFYKSMGDMLSDLDLILKPGDVFLTLGAGSITNVGPAWLAGDAHA